MKVLVKMVHGSTMYGLETPNSDIDYKGVYLPDPIEMLSGVKPKVIDESTGDHLSKNTKGDVDSQMYPIQKFLGMLSVGDMVAIDMLHASPLHILESSPEWRWLQANRSMFYSRNMAGLLGYIKKQAARYGVRGSRVAALEKVKQYLEQYEPTQRLRETQYKLILADIEHIDVTVDDWLTVTGKRFSGGTIIKDVLFSVTKTLESYGNRAKLAAKNEGVDWKAVSHALRAAYQLEEILTTGDLNYPLKDRDFLLKVKTGQLDFVSVVQPELEMMVDKVVTLSENATHLPENVSNEVIETVIKKFYQPYLK